MYSYFEKDFDEAEEYTLEDLDIYPYEAIKEFIDESIELCIHEIEAVKGKKDFTNPRDYFVATTR